MQECKDRRMQECENTRIGGCEDRRMREHKDRRTGGHKNIIIYLHCIHYLQYNFILQYYNQIIEFLRSLEATMS